MITAIATFVLLLALGYIIFVHSGKQEGINKTIGYVVIGVIAVAIIAIPVYSLARGLGRRGDFARGIHEGRPGMQGGMFTPDGFQEGQGRVKNFRDFNNCPQGGMQDCPQGMEGWDKRQGGKSNQQFRCTPRDFPGQPDFPRRPNRPGISGEQPGYPPTPGTQQGDKADPNANSGNRRLPVNPNRSN